MVQRLLHLIREVRWSLLGWNPGSDAAFHDELFASPVHDPFSCAYPGYVTIRRFADLASSCIGPGGTVADLGCGPGEITCELARRHPETAFVGVDHSAVAIARAQEHARRLELRNVEFVQSDLLQYKPPVDCELITLFDSFHHLVEPSTFVQRLRSATRRFLLIEPAGNALGQWRESSDFDWVAADLDAIREKLDAVFGAPVHGSHPHAGVSTSDEPVERRYTLDDFERFFQGFTLRVQGTTSGLVAYPPSPAHQTEWRSFVGAQSYAFFKAIDDRLVRENRDLWSRHWVIVAEPGPAADRRACPGRPLRLSDGQLVAPYAVEYGAFDLPRSTHCDTVVEGQVTLHNRGSLPWPHSGEHPVHVGYRWRDRHGVEIAVEALRSALPHDVPPGETVRVAFRCRVPARPGGHHLCVDLVKEGVTWFSERGVPPLKVSCRVR